MAEQLHIKNMVCDRCIMVVKQLFIDLGVEFHQIQLGQVELKKEPDPEQLEQIRSLLQQNGFELLDDKKSKIVEKIKTTIVSLIHGTEAEELNLKLSAILEEKLQTDYHYLSTLFSSVEGVTIERYTILQRIEKVKELLMYDEKSLSEIAYEMGYSSVQHLSQQFKKITGLTPSHFKQLKENKRKPLDKIND
ncbi:MAG: helix-turn-helix transcriptional regulator [Sediminibacterium sp.]|jgi:AraC family transcriptional regulator|uniref:helix-turn-helix domain-containing protein n=1 Tax=Sediminibacterium sp. TaxID=1917865 RepID=UPI002ABB6FC9|nr:helix-turn-helix transcriptional regulator [Sediminibacterium sp.]MDZ4072711.1 helix-turn-helix transcriptional regulator [Sediminibacterium sp.]